MVRGISKEQSRSTSDADVALLLDFNPAQPVTVDTLSLLPNNLVALHSAFAGFSKDSRFKLQTKAD